MLRFDKIRIHDASIPGYIYFMNKKTALTNISGGWIMNQSREPLSYAGINRIRFEGSDSTESSQFWRTPPGP